MRRIARLVATTAVVFAGVFAAERPATAQVTNPPPPPAVGYPCSVNMYWASSTPLGKHGNVAFMVYSQPHCGGTLVNYLTIPTQGATYCDKSAWTSEAQLLSLLQSLVLADISGTRLSASLAPAVNVPGSNFYTCIGQLAFDPQ